ncbi:hypothetical protein TNCV_3675801 [Trichonephila clavipes]|nr:hypothetical protein TNCV_3675801 [Trichonephila clavipes]
MGVVRGGQDGSEEKLELLRLLSKLGKRFVFYERQLPVGVVAQTPSLWFGEEVRRGMQLSCRPRHLTMIQNNEAKSPRVAE